MVPRWRAYAENLHNEARQILAFRFIDPSYKDPMSSSHKGLSDLP